MQFLLLVLVDDAFSPPETIGSDTEAWVREMDDNGVRIVGDRLSAARSAVTLRVRGGSRTLDDGSVLDVDGHLVGFDLVECRDREHAIEVAAAHPMAAAAAIEIRALWAE